MILLPGLVVPRLDMWAVFADEEGNPVFEPVVCLGVFEVDDKGRRLVSAFTQGDHVESADFKPNFVAVTRDVVEYEGSPGRWGPDVAQWFERCQAKRRAINEAKAQQKIVIPGDGGIVQGVFNPNQN